MTKTASRPTSHRKVNHVSLPLIHRKHSDVSYTLLSWFLSQYICHEKKQLRKSKSCYIPQRPSFWVRHNVQNSMDTLRLQPQGLQKSWTGSLTIYDVHTFCTGRRAYVQAGVFCDTLFLLLLEASYAFERQGISKGVGIQEVSDGAGINLALWKMELNLLKNCLCPWQKGPISRHHILSQLRPKGMLGQDILNLL